MSDMTPQRRWAWLVPSPGAWLWLLVVLLLLSPAWRTVMVSADGDACFHWRVGEYMLETGKIIRQEVFSHTRYGAPLISKEWLAEIVFALGAKLPIASAAADDGARLAPAGLTGLSIVAALLIATTFALLHRQLVREGSDLVTATLVVILAMWAATTHWLARPHVFSFLLLVLWNGALRQHLHRPRPGRLIAWLAPLTLVWVNLHGGYIAGFLVLGAYWWGTIFEKNLQRFGHLTLTGFVCGIVALFNPNGLRLHLHNLQFVRNDFFTGWLAEYQSLNFQTPAGTGFLVWLALLLGTLAFVRPRLRPTDIVLLVMWGYFALFAGRNVPLFALLTAPIIAAALSPVVRQRWAGLCQRLDQTNAQVSGWPTVAVLAAVLILAVPRPTTLPEKDWPLAALEYVRAHPDRFTGPVFNQYLWGGYFLQFVPEHKVFVDGRADFYGEELVREFDDATALRPGWQAILAKYGVTWTIMPTDHRLNAALELLPGWERAYRDDVATIFVKRP